MDTKAFELFNEVVDRLMLTGLSENEAIYMVAELIETQRKMMEEIEKGIPLSRNPESAGDALYYTAPLAV